jgi:hypothetical protein
MTDDQTLTTALGYYRAWTTAKDFDAAAQLLSPELETDLPVNTYAGRPEFVEAITGFGGLISAAELLVATATGNDAVLVYDLTMNGLGALRIAEQCTVIDGRITFIRQVHDTATMRAAGFAPPLSDTTEQEHDHADHQE